MSRPRLGPLDLLRTLLEHAEELAKLPAMVRLRVAIFLDQQSRNERVEKEVEDLIAHCASLARDLAGGLLTELPDLKATSAEVCFLTLVLRHTGRIEDVRLAQQLLEDLPRSELVEAFGRRNAEVLQRLEALRYVAEAAEHRPGRAGRVERPRELRCLAGAADMAWLQPGCWQLVSENAMVQELQEELESRGLWTPEAQLILSYSGGVDSTAHLLLLRALLEQPGCPHLRCLLLVYPNREAWEVEAEKAWASWVCQELLGSKLLRDSKSTKAKRRALHLRGAAGTAAWRHRGGHQPGGVRAVDEGDPLQDVPLPLRRPQRRYPGPSSG